MTEGLREVAARHVGDTNVPGVVPLVAHGEEVQVEALGHLTIGIVIVLTQREFDSSDLPPLHRDVQDTAYAAVT